jgi:hypothetical protein
MTEVAQEAFLLTLRRPVNDETARILYKPEDRPAVLEGRRGVV